MTTAVLHLTNGEQCRINVESGQSLMQAAKAANVPGIDADCGGSMVCGTCHVVVANAWLGKLPAPCGMEEAILEGVPEPHPRARLSCQIKMDDALDGIEVDVPAAQR